MVTRVVGESATLPSRSFEKRESRGLRGLNGYSRVIAANGQRTAFVDLLCRSQRACTGVRTNNRAGDGPSAFSRAERQLRATTEYVTRNMVYCSIPVSSNVLWNFRCLPAAIRGDFGCFEQLILLICSWMLHGYEHGVREDEDVCVLTFCRPCPLRCFLQTSRASRAARHDEEGQQVPWPEAACE